MAANNNNNNGPAAWRLIPPGEGEPTTKTVNNVVFKYCAKCRNGKGMWMGGDKAHTTEEHRGREARNPETPSNEREIGGNLGTIEENSTLEINFG